MGRYQNSKPSIAAVVLTKNEAENISGCLKSLTWCNELIVIDDLSTDGTPEIAKKFGARVFSRFSASNFASQRNFALRKATSEWVLFIDVDEKVTQNLKKEILSNLKERKDVVGFRMKRQDIFLGRKLRFGETARVELLRLGKRDAGIWKRPVHEVWEIDGRIGELKEKLIHLPHPTITDFLSEINNYTEIESQYRKKLGRRSSLIELLTYPSAKFVKNYFFLLGFFDGLPGLVMAFMMSLHSLCVRVKMMQGQ